MKSERRHELQQNAMVTQMVKLKEFLKTKGNLLAWGLLVVAIIALVAAFWYRHSQTVTMENETAFTQLVLQPDLSGSPEERISKLEAQLAKESSDFRAAEICCTIGDNYARLALIAKTDADRKTYLDKATEYYQRAAKNYPKETLTVAKSHLGLAKIAETLGDFDKADAEYNAVTAVSGLSETAVFKLAVADRERLKEMRKPAKFASTAPVATSAPASRPAASMPASAAASKPAGK